MTVRVSELRHGERWIDCEAVRTVYDRLKHSDKVKFARLQEMLGPSQLGRMRGAGGRGTQKRCTKIQEANIKLFADICDVNVTSILANSDGLSALADNTFHLIEKTTDVSFKKRDQLDDLIYALEHHHPNPEGVYWIGQTLVECRSFARSNGLPKAISVIDSMMDDIDNDLKLKDAAFSVIVSPRKIVTLIDILFEHKQKNTA